MYPQGVTLWGADLDFGDLEEVEFYRSFTAEDGHQDFNFTFGLIDGVDSAKQVSKRSVNNLDRFTY